MDFSKIISNDAPYIDQDTISVMQKYNPIFSEFSILAEYNALRDQTKLLQDLYVIPSLKDPLHWFGLIFIRTNYYAGATFRFNIFIGKNFPQTDIPSIVFNPPIFHPKVDPVTGHMETKTSFGKWQLGIHHIWHLLLYIKKSLLVIDECDPVNQIAADLFNHDKTEFQIRVKECIAECKERLNSPNQYSTDPHFLTFTDYNPNIHGTFRKAVLANAKASSSNTSAKPLSWVKPGTLDPCSNFDD